DGQTINTNQRSDLPALWTRIRSAAQTAQRVEIIRHPVTPQPQPTPPAELLTLLAQNVVFTAWDPMVGLLAPPGCWLAITADIHVACSPDDDEQTRTAKAAAHIQAARAAAKARRGPVACW